MRLPFGRVLVQGEARHCLFDGAAARLLDRPAYADGVQETGVAARAACRLLAPVQPGKVVAVGLNYRAHAEEFRMEVPAEPILFLKPSTSVIGPGDTIVRPARSRRVDYEAELAVVMGRRCHDVTADTAAHFIAGYTCGNDVTARDLQKVDGQWTRAKGFDTFCPLGPWAVTDAPGPEAAVTASIDGAEAQRGLIGDMIVSPLELVAFISRVMTLEAGDVILTGTPPGVGSVQDGQQVTVAVEGIGELTNPVG